MPFDAHVTQLLETALAEGFKFHKALDLFITRSGIPAQRLAKARTRAEERTKQSGRFSKAPKRFVAQELLTELDSGSPEDDKLLAGLITSLSKARLADATLDARLAIEGLVAERDAVRAAADERRAHEKEEARANEVGREQIVAQKMQRRDEFRNEFLEMSQQESPQARGYMLEKFLNGLFEYEGLNPRSSFRLVGEQIDGSFSWNSRTHLVEAKWTKEPVSGKEFSAFIYKIDGKTVDTRGLFVAVNGYSQQAMEGLGRKGALQFVCIDGAHLMRCFDPNWSLVRLLKFVWRHADETGEAYLPVSKIPSE